MRYDPRTATLATYFAILLFNAYTFSLYFDGQLTLYIHPRYVLFTVAMSAVSAVICGTGFALMAWRMRKVPPSGGAAGSGLPWRPAFTFVAAGLVLVAAYTLPARTLSSDIASQRSGNFNVAQVGTSGSGAGDTLALFGADTARLDIPDWVSAFNLRASPEFYEGKKVDVVGFVFHPENAPPDVFYVSRFRVTCCAVDAQPLGLPVRSSGWRERFEEDAWVRVVGSFAPSGGDVAEPAAIDPRSIETTAQPKNPYVVD